MTEIDFNAMLEKKEKEITNLVSMNRRLTSLVQAYRVHLDLFEKELQLLQNNDNFQLTTQKDDKFNVYTNKAFIALTTARIAKNNRDNYILAIFDIDNFKSINDTYGHFAGDLALKRFSEILQSSCREEIDLVGRFGGDEFILLFENTSYEDAVSRLNLILNVVSSTPIIHTHDGMMETFYVTTSVGLTEYDRTIPCEHITDVDEKNLTEEEIIQRKIYHANFLVADKSLYNAKQNGKNQLFGKGSALRIKRQLKNITNFED